MATRHHSDQMSFFDRPAPQRKSYGARRATNSARGGRRSTPDEMGYLGGNTKFSFITAFGYPPQVTAQWTTILHRRSAAAAAAVQLVVSRCWQTDPVIRRTEGEEEPQEVALNRIFDRLGLWKAMREADRRSLAGSYSGLILRIRDGKPLSEPVDSVRGGPEAIAEVIPVWQGDLHWHSFGENRNDPDTYGKVTMYDYIERDATGKRINVVQIHPDRVLLLSEDGTMWCRPYLEPAFNACIDLEKARGSGGEGLMKDARALTHFDVAAEAELADGIGGITSKTPGKETGPIAEEVSESVGDQMEDINSQFDNIVMTKGISSKMLQTKIRGVSDTAWIAMNNVAAAVGIPVNILFGNQTGERAASQDEREWAHTCESRRWSVLRPRILDFIDRLVRWGIIDGSNGEWRIEWAALAEANVDDREKMARAVIHAYEIGRESGVVTVTQDEIRAALGFAPLTAEQVTAEVARIGEAPAIERPAPQNPPVDTGGRNG